MQMKHTRHSLDLYKIGSNEHVDVLNVENQLSWQGNIRTKQDQINKFIYEIS